jgi:hypothetical protein
MVRVKAEGKRGGEAPTRGDVRPYAKLRRPKLRNMVNLHLLVQVVCVKLLGIDVDGRNCEQSVCTWRQDGSL